MRIIRVTIGFLLTILLLSHTLFVQTYAWDEDSLGIIDVKPNILVVTGKNAPYGYEDQAKMIAEIVQDLLGFKPEVVEDSRFFPSETPVIGWVSDLIWPPLNIMDYKLICIGGPEYNRVTQQLNDFLPLYFNLQSGHWVVVDKTTNEVYAETERAWLVEKTDNPHNPRNWAIVVAGFTIENQNYATNFFSRNLPDVFASNNYHKISYIPLADTILYVWISKANGTTTIKYVPWGTKAANVAKLLEQSGVKFAGNLGMAVYATFTTTEGQIALASSLVCIYVPPTHPVLLGAKVIGCLITSYYTIVSVVAVAQQTYDNLQYIVQNVPDKMALVLDGDQEAIDELSTRLAGLGTNVVEVVILYKASRAQISAYESIAEAARGLTKQVPTTPQQALGETGAKLLQKAESLVARRGDTTYRFDPYTIDHMIDHPNKPFGHFTDIKSAWNLESEVSALDLIREAIAKGEEIDATGARAPGWIFVDFVVEGKKLRVELYKPSNLIISAYPYK